MLTKEAILVKGVKLVATPPGNAGSFQYTVGRGEPNPPRYPNPAWFINYAPDGKRPIYVGKLDPETGVLTTTRNSRVDEDDLRFKVVERIMARLWAGQLDEVTKAGWSVTTVEPVKDPAAQALGF